MRIHLVLALGTAWLDRLNALQLQSLYSSKLDSGLSVRTVRMIHTTLHKALKQAVRWSLITRNVTEAVDPPREQKTEIRPLDEGQMTLLEAVWGDSLEALYVLAVTTGMRSGELLGLRWEDVDLQAGTLHSRWGAYRDLVQAAVMEGVEYVCLAVSNVYRYKSSGKPATSRDYANTRKLAEAIYGHSRLHLPYGLILIGY